LDNKNNPQILKTLISKNRQILEEMGWIPLYIAAEKNHLSIINACLDEKPLFNKCVLSGRTPIQLAAKAGHREILKQLASNEQILNLENGSSMSYILAILNHQWEIVDDLHLTPAIRSKLGTLLHSPAKYGEVEIVKLLFSCYTKNIGFDVNELNPEGLTAFQLAVEHNRIKIVKLFCKNATKLNLDINTFNSDGLSILMSAITNKKTDIIRVLCEEAKYTGLNVNSRNPKDGTTALFLSVKMGSIEFAKMLLDAKADVNAIVDHLTPLEWAIQNSDFNMIKLLLEYGASLRRIEKVSDPEMMSFITDQLIDELKPYTLYMDKEPLLLEKKLSKLKICDHGKLNPDALLLAIKTGDIDIVKNVISKGAKSSTDNLELYTAVQLGNPNILQILCENAIKTNVTGYPIPLRIQVEAFREGNINFNIQTPLDLAVSKGDIHAVKILCQYAETIHIHYPENAFKIAVELNHLEIVEILATQAKKLKLNIHEGDNDGCTPLHISVNPQTVKLLCHLGMNVNEKNRYGGTPLGDSITNNAYEVAKVLLDYKADVNLMTMDFDSGQDFSPLETAIQKKNLKMIQLLLEYGAEVKNLNLILDSEIRCFVTLQLLAQHIKTFPWSPKRPDIADQQEKYIAQQPLDAKIEWSVVLKNVMEMQKDVTKTDFSAQQFTYFSKNSDNDQLKLYLDCFSSIEKLEDTLCKIQMTGYSLNKPR
jgi:ankyrin repeat protein